LPFGIAAELAAAVSQHAQDLDIVLLEERQHTVIEQIGGRDRRLAIVEFGEGDLGVGVDEGLLIEKTSTRPVGRCPTAVYGDYRSIAVSALAARSPDLLGRAERRNVTPLACKIERCHHTTSCKN
jgi:hypothetical protein